MNNIQIAFTEKELQVIELLNPGKTPEETCNSVIRNWFVVSAGRLHTQLQTPDAMVDDIIEKTNTVKKDSIK